MLINYDRPSTIKFMINYDKPLDYDKLWIAYDVIIG